MNLPHVKITAAAAGGYLTAMFSTYLQPLVLQSLRDSFHLSPSLVGTLVAIDAGMCALTAMALGFAASRWRISYRAFGVGGVLLATLANLLCSVTSSLPLIMGLRVLAGAGEGLAMSAGLGAVGALPKPDRMIAAVLVVGAFGGTVAIILAPILHVVGSAYRMYAYQGVVTFLIGMFMFWLPAAKAAPLRKAAPTAQAASQTRGIKLFIALLGSALVGISASMVWAFATMVGTHTGLTVPSIATVISAAANCGILGSAAAGVLGTRFGRAWPIGIAVMVECAALAFLFTTSRPAAFVVGLCSILLIGMFIRPFVMGIGSLLDPSGGLPGSMSGLFRLGGFIGPMAGGVAIQYFNTPMIVVVGQFLLMPTIAVLFLALSRSSHALEADAQRRYLTGLETNAASARYDG